MSRASDAPFGPNVKVEKNKLWWLDFVTEQQNKEENSDDGRIIC
jgi:hypothetical protein